MSRVNLAAYRIDKAKGILEEAEDSLKLNHFAMAVNRSYYAMFTAARALLALKELDSSKHSGIISLFNQHIIKAGLFPKEFSKFLSMAKDMREDADYRDFIKITDEDAGNQIDHAQKFVEEAEKTLRRMIQDDQ